MAFRPQQRRSTLHAKSSVGRLADRETDVPAKSQRRIWGENSHGSQTSCCERGGSGFGIRRGHDGTGRGRNLHSTHELSHWPLFRGWGCHLQWHVGLSG